MNRNADGNTLRVAVAPPNESILQAPRLSTHTRHNEFIARAFAPQGEAV